MLTDLSSVSSLIPTGSLTDISGLFNIQPFNPMDLVTQNSNNIMSQLQAASSIRKQLDNVRNSVALDVANADLAAMKSYATDLQSHGQDMFVTGFTAPSLTTITPDTVTNPLSSDLLGGLTGELTTTSLTEGLMNEGSDLLSGDLAATAENVLDSGLGDLAVSGAGMYVSAMTGGAVPPSIASAVIGTAADAGLGVIQGESPSLSSLGGDLASNALGGVLGSGSIAGALTGSSSLTSTLASSINGMSLGSNSMTSILGETTSSSIFGDITGGTFEGITDKITSSVGEAVVGAASGNSSFSFDTITDAASSFTKSFAGDVVESVGGINLSDTGSLVDSIVTKGLDVAKEAGDVSTFSNLLDNFSKDKGIFSSDVIDLVENVIDNPYNLRNYTELMADVGVNLGSVISTGASYGSDAIRKAAEVVGFDPGVVDRASGLLDNALDSKLFNKLTSVGDRIAREVLDDETYRQLDALQDLGDIVSSSSGKSGSYNRANRNNRKVVRAMERIFNNGRSFGDKRGTSFRFDTDITRAIDQARWVLR